MTALHTAYVNSSGRDTYTFSCTCGARGGNWSSREAAKAAARRHGALIAVNDRADIAFAAGADVLLVECYNYDRPLANHLDYKTLAARRSDLATPRIVLTHMGPGMLAHDGPLPEERAHDGMVIVP